jgi:hypothetical protein
VACWRRSASRSCSRAAIASAPRVMCRSGRGARARARQCVRRLSPAPPRTRSAPATRRGCRRPYAPRLGGEHIPPEHVDHRGVGLVLGERAPLRARERAPGPMVKASSSNKLMGLLRPPRDTGRDPRGASYGVYSSRLSCSPPPDRVRATSSPWRGHEPLRGRFDFSA